MNKQFSREEIQKILQRWHQLKMQFGDQAVNVPEFAHLSKIIKFLQQNQQAQQQRQQVNQSQQQFQSQQQNQPSGSTHNLQNIGQSMHIHNHVQQQANNNVMDINQGKNTPNIPNANIVGNAKLASNGQGSDNLMLQQQQQITSVPQISNSGRMSVSHNHLSESAFTNQQFQLVKAQYQALKFLLKTPNSESIPIPQNLIDFVTSEGSAFPNGPYIPLSNPNQPSTQGISSQSQYNIHPQDQAQAAQPVFGMAQQTSNPVHPFIQQNKPVVNNNSPSIQYKNMPKRPSKSRSPSEQYKKPANRKSLKGEVSPKELETISLEPKPPINIDELVPEKSDSSKVIVNINKPYTQVDTFEVPKLMGEEIEDIEFISLYNSQGRFEYPSILPEGINLMDISVNRDILINLQIDEEMSTIKRKLNSLNSQNQDEKAALEEQLYKLELLPFQKEMRGKILSQIWFSNSLLPNSHPNFIAKFNSLSIENTNATNELYRSQLDSLVRAQNQKHQIMINQILATKRSRSIVSFRKKEKLDRFSSKVNSFHNQTAKEEQKKLEKMAKQRLQALKSNDEEAYLKLLDHTKDTRITHLLKQTNQFLDSLAQAVQSQQRDAKEKFSQNGNASTGTSEMDTTMDEEKREKMDYYHVAHRIREEVTIQPSILVGGTLKEYQLKGLQWMVSLFNNHLNGILADEMGLGKTIQTISLLTYLIEVKRIRGPFLVIVPLSTLTNWNLEFEKWAPSVKKITYKGTPNQRKIMQQSIKMGDFQILLTTFEYIIKDKALLSKIKWVHMIIDEGHRMKNANSKLSETLTHNYHSDYRLILTGTPLQNNLPELWALLNFVLPKIFNSVKSFDEWFNTPFANTGGQDKIELSEEETLLVIRRLHKVLRPFLLRRLKKDVEKDLPNKVEKVVKCKMSSLQSKLYQQMLKYNILFAGDPENPNVPVTIKNANNQIMQLRKICNHPFVYEEVENLISPVPETNDQIWRVAGKFELLDRILPKFRKTGHRILLFFQMTQIMDIMEDFLRLRGLKYMRLDGSTKADDRTALLKLFNAPDSDYFCFLLSTRAGGLGLNLQTADTVIIFDTDWNPHQDLQAQDRAHRIGQKNEVRILRLITEDSVEEMILERAHAKLEIDGKVIQAGKFDNKSTAEEQEALLRALIEKEEERKQKGGSYDDDDLDDDELNQVIARTEHELEVFRELDEARIIETKEAPYPTRLFSDQELPEIYKKDPKIYLQKDELASEYGRGTRERKTAAYDDNLTEEQWLKQIEGMVSDDSDSDSEIKKRIKGRSRTKKSIEDDEILSDTPRASADYKSELKRKDDNDSAVGSPNVLPSNKRQKSSTPKISSLKSKGKSRTKGRSKISFLNRSIPSIDPLTTEERTKLQSSTETIYNLITNYTNNERNLSELFLIKPSRKLYPDYYVLIKNPIALDVIRKRMNTKAYSQIREFLEDLHLIFSNARIYNEEGSIVYEDAKLLEELAIDQFKGLYVDLSPEDQSKILDFSEFDETLNLKPLSLNSNSKEESKPDVDNSESAKS